jgi:glyoxylase I family protein
MKIEHVALNVLEPAKVARWYVEHLGMRLVRSSSESPYIHFVADSMGSSVIELYCNPLAAVPDYAAMHPVTLHLALVVEDMPAERARLLAAGATAEGEIATMPNGDQLAFVRDPWGVTLQLAQRVKPLVS